jgi:hypothetical protein
MASNPDFEQRTLKWWFTTESVGTRPSSWEVALHSGDPGTGSANELTDANYERQPIEFEVVADGDGYISRNDADVVFPGLAASVTVSFMTIRDAATGNSIRAVQMDPPKSFSAGGVPRIPVNELVLEGV